jgi:D-serine deaminase-like pyridoxal phosphate-dependent protein
LIAIGRALVDGGATLRGVLTHAGASYALDCPEELATAARNERDMAVKGAELLRAAGLPCAVISMGSTPTVTFATDLAGITEVRAGVYMFGDLVQAGIGTCSLDDIALSVLATVIGTRPDKGWIIVDAGWMALSRDRGTQSQRLDYGYGLVCNEHSVPYPDLIVLEVNQEHGVIGLRPGSGAKVPILPIGSLVRILPNHACATGGQHDRYQVVSGDIVVAEWWRANGW